MKKSNRIVNLTVLVLMVLTINPLKADDGLSRREVLRYPLMSVASSVAMVTSVGFIDSADVTDLQIPLWFSAVVTAEHLPLYAQNPSLARKYSLAHGVLAGSHYASNDYPTWSLVPFNAHIKLAMYSTYESYSIARLNAAPGVYAKSFHSHSMKDLALAPFQWKNLKHRVFTIPFGVSAIFQVASMLSSDDAIWKTGKTFVDGEEMSPGLSIPLITGANLLNNVVTAVGEEALYRGVIYEELKVSYGAKKAKLYDFFIFPAIHVPQDIARGSEMGEITGLFIMRGLSTLLFDYAYDKGGLPLSVTLHSWLNMLGYTTRWLGSAGVPGDEADAGSNSIGPAMNFGFTIRF